MTAWPLIWTIEPANPNWVGTVGDNLLFTVKAIPDPNYTVDTGGDGSGGTVTPPSPPTNIQLTVIDSNLDSSYYTLTNDTASITVDDVRIFLPFTSIKFEKDSQVYQVQYEEELNEIGYDFVFEFIPYPDAFDTRFISLRATSTSDEDLIGTFNFRINNNFDAVRTSLINIVDEGDTFLSSIEEGDGIPPNVEVPENNETVVTTPIFRGKYQEPDDGELFSPPEGKNVDRLIRNDNQTEIENVIGDGSGLTKTPPTRNKKMTTLPENPSDNDLQNWFDNLGD